jgi:type II secretory pathway pseudopilin PulG
VLEGRRAPLRPRTRNAVERWDGGYALLALIFALMVIAVMLTAAAPQAKTQAQREREIEMMYRGDEMAEAIARYYSQGRLLPTGLVVKTPPPAYGYLTELRKLRDGVTIGNQQVFFVRTSAAIDPMTNEEWEPIRIGDPRLRKFFRAWQQFTGRQIPPIYASYLGAGGTLDTSEHPEGEDDGDAGDDSNPNTNEDDEVDPEDDDSDEEDDGSDDEEEDDEDDDEGDDGESLNLPGRAPSDGLFVAAAYQIGPGSGTLNTNSRPLSNANTNRGFKNPGFTFGNGTSQRTGPIIGVVSKKKGETVVTRFGLTHYEEMIFIYIPPQILGLPGQQQQQQGTPGQQQGTDSNGDGIPDGLTPNPKPDGQQQ